MSSKNSNDDKTAKTPSNAQSSSSALSSNILLGMADFRQDMWPVVFQKYFLTNKLTPRIKIQMAEADQFSNQSMEYVADWSAEEISFDIQNSFTLDLSATSCTSAKSVTSQLSGWKQIVDQDKDVTNHQLFLDAIKMSETCLNKSTYMGKPQRRCDGLCGQFYELEKLQIFNGCSHLICKGCAIKDKLGNVPAYMCGNIDCFIQRKILALSDTKEQAGFRDVLFQPTVDYDALFKRLIIAAERETKAVSSNSGTSAKSSSSFVSSHTPYICSSSIFAYTPKRAASIDNGNKSDAYGKQTNWRNDTRERRQIAQKKRGCRVCNIS